jgi:hypothetical protein
MQKMLAIVLLLIVFISKDAIAPQNNFSEDYSRYLPEIQTYYKSQPAFPKMAITPGSSR